MTNIEVMKVAIPSDQGFDDFNFSYDGLEVSLNASCYHHGRRVKYFVQFRGVVSLLFIDEMQLERLEGLFEGVVEKNIDSWPIKLRLELDSTINAKMIKHYELYLGDIGKILVAAEDFELNRSD